MTDELYRRFVPGYNKVAAALDGPLVAAAVDDAILPGAPAPPPVPPGPPAVPSPAVVAALVGPNEVPLLTLELLDEIRAQLRSEPTLTLKLARRAIDRDLSEADLHVLLDQLEAGLKNPVGAMVAADVGEPIELPPDFTFPGIETNANFQARPSDHVYEDGDKWGYGLNCAGAILKRVVTGGLTDFRWHDDYQSAFMYHLKDNAKVGLFSDFGTGLPHTWYIAKFLAANAPDCSIHLGDVYYAGKTVEKQLNFDAPLIPYNTKYELWNLAGNHDYYSNGSAYFTGIDQRRAGTGIGITDGRRHRQEGSYFCLESKAFCIIAIDEEYHSFFGTNPQYREPRLKAWMVDRITAAKAANKSVILMSSDEPYSIGDSKLTELYFDVVDQLQPDAIDLWFWGNTHYCAFFDHSPDMASKFYGACIGHGGFPYSTLKPNPAAAAVAPYRWAETEPRFPRWTNIRPDMGNNGFVMMELDDDNAALSLKYFDWTNDLRAVVKLSKQGNQLRSTLVAGQKRDLRRKPQPAPVPAPNPAGP